MSMCVYPFLSLSVQHVNITEQLRRGVRWLDLRVCKFLEASPDDTPETAGKTARKDKTGEKRPVSSSSSSESRERSGMSRDTSVVRLFIVATCKSLRGLRFYRSLFVKREEKKR